MEIFSDKQKHRFYEIFCKTSSSGLRGHTKDSHFLPKAKALAPSTLQGCGVGTLPNGFIRQSPLLRIPQVATAL